MSSGKYGDLIRQARQPNNQVDNQTLSEPNTKEPDNQKDGQNLNEQKALVAGEQKNHPPLSDQITREPDNQNSKQPDAPAEPEVNLCVKVPISLRRHWAAEAKRQGVTMTQIIIEALRERFGKPDS